MATRSNIGMRVGDNRAPWAAYQYIYCHWDGYPSHNGMILLHNYKSDREVSDLLSGGDLSSLGDSLENSVYFASDRGEKLEEVSVRYADDRDAIYQEEWAYVWEDGKWWVKGHGQGWQPLTEELCKDER